MATPAQSGFVAPSPGAWELERTHLTRPVSGFLAPIFPKAMPNGFGASLRHYGALLEKFDVAVIKGFVYMCPRPVGAPKTAKAPPPRLVFEILRRVHPEIRRRIRRSKVVFRDAIWRGEIIDWDSRVKPGIAARAGALKAQDIATLSAADLAAHVQAAAALLEHAIESHHRFNMCAMLPLGDFLAHAMEWTGADPGGILQAMRGLSPVSAGGAAELHALRLAVETDAEAQTLLHSDAPAADILDGLAGRPGPVGNAMRAYVDEVGLRCMGGYDVSESHVREHPALLLSIIRTGMTGHEATKGRDEAVQAVSAIRARVPATHHTLFDELLEEARVTYRIRDERVFHGDALALGVARRAILEAGRRLAASGRVRDPEHLIDATSGEIAELLDSRGPSADDLAARTHYRLNTPIDSAPPRLGFAPSPPPPANWLPPAAARIQRAIDTMLDLMFAAREQEPSPAAQSQQATPLRGFAASPGTFEGPARVVRNAGELPTVRAGEVLITPSTAPTFNVVLPLIGAIVTERGGALSHAAIVAREYGLPAVVGCVGAMAAVRNGTRVRVDGAKGELWVLD